MERPVWRDATQSVLAPGVRVALRSDPHRVGAIALVLHDHVDRYVVRWDDGGTGDLVAEALRPET